MQLEFIKRGAYFLNAEEREKVRQVILIDGRLNTEIVGQSVQKMAQIAGFTVPSNIRVLMGEVDGVGKEEPLLVKNFRQFSQCTAPRTLLKQ